MADSSIEWTDKTWNPTTGCTRVSPGCKNCYAFAIHDMRHAAYLAGKKVAPQYAKPFKELQLFEDRLEDPLHWRAPKRVFVNSMSDLFHKDVPDEFIGRVFAVMALASRHTFQILTKRPERMAEYLSRSPSDLAASGENGWLDSINRASMEMFGKPTFPTQSLGMVHHLGWPLPNLWLGTSVENQAAADERIPHLLRTPAAVRFLSCEPLLGPVDLEPYLQYPPFHDDYKMTFGATDFRGIDWVIVGCESGRGMRPMHMDWAESLRDQCKAAGVNFFMKQMVVENGGVSGNMERFPLPMQVREFPVVLA